MSIYLFIEAQSDEYSRHFGSSLYFNVPELHYYYYKAALLREKLGMKLTALMGDRFVC